MQDSNTGSRTGHSEAPKPSRRASPLVLLGLTLGLLAVVGLSFILNSEEGLLMGDVGLSGTPIPEVRPVPLPGGGDPSNLPASPSVGRMAPDFAWTAEDGKVLRLSDYRGKSVLLNFWATWCPPCKAEMPEIEAYWKENSEKGVMVLAVDVGAEDEATVRRYMQQRKLTFQALNDPAGQVGFAYMSVASRRASSSTPRASSATAIRVA